MDQNGEQRQQGEHLGEMHGEETSPDFIRDVTGAGHKANDIENIQHDDDGGSAK